VKVLLAVDKTQVAEEAVQSVGNCFPGAEVEILYVLDLEAYPHPHLSAALIDWYHKKIRALLQAEANQFLPKLVEPILRVAGRVRVLVREGRTTQVILETATSSGADLIVLGSRGLTGVQSLLLGGVSYGVAQRAPCPVLLVKNVLPDRPRILLALDRSESAQNAVRFLAEQSFFAPSSIMLLMVLPSPSLLKPWASTGQGPEVIAYFRALEAKLAARGYAVESRIVRGDSAAVILKHADGAGIDLLMTGTGDRRTWVKSWLGRNPSLEVLVHSRTSVLLVPGGGAAAHPSP